MLYIFFHTITLVLFLNILNWYEIGGYNYFIFKLSLYLNDDIWIFFGGVGDIKLFQMPAEVEWHLIKEESSFLFSFYFVPFHKKKKKKTARVDKSQMKELNWRSQLSSENWGEGGTFHSKLCTAFFIIFRFFSPPLDKMGPRPLIRAVLSRRIRARRRE